MKRTLHLSFGKRGVGKDVDTELRFHLDMRTREFIESGMSPEEARAAAREAFGDVPSIAARCRRIRSHYKRRVWFVQFVSDLVQDLQFAIRSLSKVPAYTLTILVTLGLGIGASTAVFSLVNGVLIQALPYDEEDRLVHLRQSAPAVGIENAGFSPLEVQDYRQITRSFADLVEYHSMDFTLLGLEEPLRVQTGVVSAEFFDLFGVEPLLGRTFDPADDRPTSDAVLVLSHRFWKRAFEGDPDVVGRELQMNDRVHTVVGVLPPVPQYPDENDVYMPVSSCPFRSADSWAQSRDSRGLEIFARLASGVALPEARADLGRAASHLQAEHEKHYPASGLAASLAPLREELVQYARPRLLVLLGISGFLLLLVCANVGNLTLARLMRREREMAIRASLGAGRGRIFRQLLAEGTLLAVAGGILAVILAGATLDLLIPFVARFTSRAAEIEVDNTVLLFTLAVALSTALFLGLLPALPGKTSLVQQLKEGTASHTNARSHHRARSALIVSQVAISFVLLIAAGLLARSFIKLQSVDPGFETDHVLTARVHLDWTNYWDGPKIRDFAARLVERLEAMPGASSAAVSNTAPLSGQGAWSLDVQIEAATPVTPQGGSQADLQAVSPDYFRTLGIRLVHGRGFERREHHPNRDSRPVVIINRTFAQRYIPAADPIGRKVCWGECESWAMIVGVVGDVKQDGLDTQVRPTLYLPYSAAGWRDMRVLLRSRLEPERLAEQVRTAVWEIDPTQAVTEVQSLSQARRDSIAAPRLATFLMGTFAVIALIITTVGIAGIIAFTVGRRTRELGIRMALGADGRHVVLMITRQALALVGLGLAFGLPASLALSQFLRSFLFDTNVRDPLTFAVVCLMITAIGAAASLVPARRATAIDPGLTLRAD